MKRPQISVIIPIYNSGNFIEHCLKSILAQTFKNIEVILIDDGSIDNSLCCCRGFTTIDKRIKLICQENKGVSSARNAGLKLAIGDYVCFVDSDDWVENDFIEMLYKRIILDHSDLVMCGFRTYYSSKDIRDSIKDVKEIISQKDIIDFIKNPRNGGHNILRNNVVAKLFKNSIISNNAIKFEENIIVGEDTLFILEYQKHIDFASVIENKLYYYNRANANSVTSSYIPHYWENFKIVKERAFEINSYAVNHTDDYKYYQYLRVAIKAVCEEGKIASGNGFFERYKNILKICGEKELEYYRMNFKLPKTNDRFYQLIRIFVRFNMPFVLTCILTVVYGGKLLK